MDERADKYAAGCFFLLFLAIVGAVFGGCYLYVAKLNPVLIQVPRNGK